MGINAIPNPAIPPGSLILVTGVNGLIASHVAEQCLNAGYRVRGTTRDAKKHAWMKNVESFSKPGAFELFEVKDMTKDGAFDEAVKGCAGVAHVASNMTFSNNYEEIVGDAVKGAMSALKSASKEPGIKRFVLTSSSTATTMPKPGKEFIVHKDTWNDEAIKLAKGKDPDGFTVYAASKTQAERQVWDWVKENKPSFVVNAVLPNANLGQPLDVKNQGHPSTTLWVKQVFDGDLDQLRGVPPQYFVHVQDTAILHYVALANPDVQNERLFAFAAPFNLNDILGILRELYPDRKFAQDLPGLEKDLSVIEPARRAEKLLEEVKGSGWTSLKDSVQLNSKDLV
ncbi:hypothetical protein EG328_000842 [Venturia inaequalis]|uniref:NAD-dependent epimerase/dehydratase domain-containing protein n=1 Tax=Venturia inaequalis TaxID=5025 RepID=A0A8H3YIW6_VENIN|nr:hypothetical protein EG328_000842 [Venturia inaequalis]KAE9990340.1 hypothetical protein EG327_001574 [Venturia inaequalis]RDI77250.1 hypothetical protein Vi05172_g12787 [Venturia inaequalis]